MVLPGDRDIMQGLSQTSLQTIVRILPQENDPEVTVTDVEYIGSYNWTNRDTPTIIVPGLCNNMKGTEPTTTFPQALRQSGGIGRSLTT